MQLLCLCIYNQLIVLLIFTTVYGWSFATYELIFLLYYDILYNYDVYEQVMLKSRRSHSTAYT